MIHHPSFYDTADKVVLLYAMMYANQSEEHEGEISYRVPPAELGYLDILATYAARALPAVIEQQGPEYDGVLWFQRLERTDEDSLAYRLLRHVDSIAHLRDLDGPGIEAEQEVCVFRIIRDWAKDRGMALSYWGKLL